MFLNSLQAKKIYEDTYILEDDLVFKYKDEIFTVPKGFTTDMATIPEPLDKVIKRDNSKYRRSAILHDFLYTLDISRKEADRMFLAAMWSEKTPWRYFIPFYISVRIFGGLYKD